MANLFTVLSPTGRNMLTALGNINAGTANAGSDNVYNQLPADNYDALINVDMDTTLIGGLTKDQVLENIFGPEEPAGSRRPTNLEKAQMMIKSRLNQFVGPVLYTQKFINNLVRYMDTAVDDPANPTKTPEDLAFYAAGNLTHGLKDRKKKAMVLMDGRGILARAIQDKFPDFPIISTDNYAWNKKGDNASNRARDSRDAIIGRFSVPVMKEITQDKITVRPNYSKSTPGGQREGQVDLAAVDAVLRYAYEVEYFILPGCNYQREMIKKILDAMTEANPRSRLIIIGYDDLIHQRLNLSNLEASNMKHWGPPLYNYEAAVDKNQPLRYSMFNSNGGGYYAFDAGFNMGDIGNGFPSLDDSKGYEHLRHIGSYSVFARYEPVPDGALAGSLLDGSTSPFNEYYQFDAYDEDLDEVVVKKTKITNNGFSTCHYDGGPLMADVRSSLASFPYEDRYTIPPQTGTIGNGKMGICVARKYFMDKQDIWDAYLRLVERQKALSGS